MPYAQCLAQAFHAAVDLVYAVEVEDIPEHLVTELEQDGSTYLKRIAGTFPKGLKPRCIVEQGPAAEVIIRQADTQEGTLVAMMTHGHSGLQRWFLGSVANKVVHAAASPILLIPVGARSPEGGSVVLERIVVPLDGSPLAEHILPHVVSLCKALDMELILVRVYNPIFPGSSIRMHEISKIVHDAAENYVKDRAQRLKDQGLNEVSYKVLRGIPAQQIVDFSLATPNSLTAMCTHGRHGVGGG